MYLCEEDQHAILDILREHNVALEDLIVKRGFRCYTKHRHCGPACRYASIEFAVKSEHYTALNRFGRAWFRDSNTKAAEIVTRLSNLFTKHEEEARKCSQTVLDCILGCDYDGLEDSPLDRVNLLYAILGNNPWRWCRAFEIGLANLSLTFDLLSECPDLWTATRQEHPLSRKRQRDNALEGLFCPPMSR